MRFFTLLPLVALLAACEAGDPVGAGPVHTATFSVQYTVDATYRTCSVTYADASRTLRREEVTSQWSKTLPVSVRTDEPFFEALVQATCAEEGRVGKVTVGLNVNGNLIDVNSNANFGATARAAGQLSGAGVARRVN